MASRFDEAAAQWDNNPARVDLARAVGAAILRSVPLQPNWRVLDYGAGTGLLTLNLHMVKPSSTGQARAYGVFLAVGRKGWG